MQVDVADERQPRAALLLQIDQHLLVLLAQAVHNHGVDGNAQGQFAAVLVALDDLEDAALDAHAHRQVRQHLAAPMAVGAVREVGRPQAFLHALAGHFDQPERRDGQHVRARLVALQGFLQRPVHGVLVLARLHVDEIDHDQPANVAQAQLPGDLDGGLGVDLQDAVFLRLAAFVPARVHVDGHHGLGLVKDQVAAGLEPHLAMQGVFELPLHLEVLKNGFGAGVELDAVLDAAGDATRHLPDAVEGLARIDHDAIDLRGQGVTHHAFDQVGLVVETAGGGRVPDAVLDLLPDVQQAAQIARKTGTAHAFGGGADDQADAGGDRQAPEGLLEPRALLVVLDLARNALELAAGHHHQVAPRDAQVRGHARALGADGPLGHLHDDLAAGGKPLGHLAGLGLLAAGPAGGHPLFGFQPRRILRNHVPVMNEGVFLQSNVHKGGLQAVLHVLNPPLVDAPHDALLGRALDEELLQMAVLHDGHPGLQAFHIDDDFTLGLFAQSDHFEPFPHITPRAVCGAHVRFAPARSPRACSP